MSQRFYEIDVVRGGAVLLMIIFHAAFDVDFLGIAEINVHRGFWLVVARAVQLIFVLTTGITLAITAGRSGINRQWYRDRLLHAAKLSVCALLITVGTWLLFDEQMIVFGILHFYVAAIIFTLPLMGLKVWNILLGVILILITPIVDAFHLDLLRSAYTALDYFPLFPWFGVFLIGVGAGAYLYKNNQRRFFLHLLSKIQMPFLQKIGRSSLIIYLVHQPILWGILKLYKIIML